MIKSYFLTTLAAASLFAVQASAQQGGNQTPPPPMTFFITSTPPGHGNLGGLEGADKICQDLAAAVGAGDKTWRAYLSTQEEPGKPAVNARDRIGTGPWHNAKGEMIAASVADLHGDNARDRNNVTYWSALTEKGEPVSPREAKLRPEGVGNQHDILTGGNSLGMAWPAGEDRTCRNWTSDSPDARGWVGHHDRTGGGNTSWNDVHLTRGGCHAAGLVATGGNGRFYCFAAN